MRGNAFIVTAAAVLASLLISFTHVHSGRMIHSARQTLKLWESPLDAKKKYFSASIANILR